MAKARAIVRGDKEIIANLGRVRRSVDGRMMEREMIRALQPMREQTEENARALRNFPGKHPGWPGPASPRRGGHLDEGVVVVKRRPESRFQRVVWLTFNKRARKLAHLVEFGTAPHYQPNLKFMHPGASPHPFARPAFESEKAGVPRSIGQAVWARISGSLLGVKRR